jgi:hypothetical protein
MNFFSDIDENQDHAEGSWFQILKGSWGSKIWNAPLVLKLAVVALVGSKSW